MRLLWGRWESGCEVIPGTGPVVLASNHISNWDAVLVGLACRRRVHFLAKQELFRNRLFGNLISNLNAIPLSRCGTDARGLRRAIEVLKRGGVLVVFPEGTRSKTGRLGRAKAGVGYVAHAGGATVIPAHITGSDRMWQCLVNRAELRLTFGKPVPVEGPATKEAYRSLTQRVMDAIAALAKERTGD
jgi:1-acyl-sn-glycerol-3-phosphate acyltransferase